MAKGDDKLIRQLSLVSYLLALDRPASAQEISRTVEGYAGMSEATFARRFHADREELARSGITVETLEDADSDRELYSLPPENYFLPDMELSPQEAKSLAVALNLLEGSFPYVRPLRLALAGLTHGRHADSEGGARPAVSLPQDEEAAEQPQQLSRLEEAVARRKRVVFEYFSAHRGATESRTVDPYGLFRWGGHWYAVGRDAGRDAERMFRLSRVTSRIEFATKRPRDFEVPDSYDPARYLNRPPWLYGEPVGQAELSVDAELAWWVERSQPHVRRLAGDAGTGARARFDVPYAAAEPLIAWVFELGPRAELTGPPEIRRLALDRLRTVVERHGGADGSGREP